MVELELKAQIDDAKKKIEEATREIEKAEAAGIDVIAMKAELATLKESLEKLEAAYK